MPASNDRPGPVVPTPAGCPQNRTADGAPVPAFGRFPAVTDSDVVPPREHQPVHDNTDAVAGRLVRVLMRQTGLSLAETAARAGLPVSLVAAWADGIEQPTLGALIRLVEASDHELRLTIAPRDRHDEALLTRTTAEERDALAAEERERVERLQAERLARLIAPDLYDELQP
jgi:transcriptional regulator with XRE-family HTH domain